MGLFSRKKRANAPGSIKSASSPTPSTCTIMPTPPMSPAVSLYAQGPPVWKPQVTLRVALDPAPLDRDETTFCVMLDQDADVASLRRAIAEHVPSASLSLFKVNIPLLAHKQAIEYRQRFSTTVNLLTSFPAFDLDDPRQVGPSFAVAWGSSPREYSADLRLNDWFPENSPADVISVLVRTSEGSSSSSSLSRTFITHFAPSEPPVASPRLGLASGSSHRAPTVVSICPERSVRDLKAEILRADGRRVMEEHLDRVILWRVEMSEEEMIVIGERGGLKNGRMPWPYPPGAPVPVSLSEDSRRISDYFPEHASNARMVSLSVWLDPRASADMPRPTPSQLKIPSFKYPMVYPEPSVAPAVARRSRQRPSTAPAVVVSSAGEESPSIPAIPAFGVRPLSSIKSGATPTSSRPGTGSTIRPRVSSPLGASPQRGLGINLAESPILVRSSTVPAAASVAPWESVTFALSSPRGSLSASECSSTDDNMLPSLSFSQLSLTIDPMEANGPLTPEVYDRDLDWLSPKSGEALRKGGSLRGTTGSQGRKFVF